METSFVTLRQPTKTAGLRDHSRFHDELLLEVPAAEAEQARALVKTVTEGALVADARLGASWADVH